MSDIAKESDDTLYPFESIGVQDRNDKLRLDKGEGFKGTLHYRAEFVPALKLKGLKFDHTAEPALYAVDADTDGGVVTDDSGSVSSSDEEFQEVPAGVTYRLNHQRHAKAKKSIDTMASVNTTDTSEVPQTPITPTTAGSGAPSVDEGVEMPQEELLKHREQYMFQNIQTNITNVLFRVWSSRRKCYLGSVGQEGKTRGSFG